MIFWTAVKAKITENEDEADAYGKCLVGGCSEEVVILSNLHFPRIRAVSI